MNHNNNNVNLDGQARDRQDTYEYMMEHTMLCTVPLPVPGKMGLYMLQKC